MVEFTEEDLKSICDFVNNNIIRMNKQEVAIADMHNLVESALEHLYPQVAQSYRNYRNYKQDFVHMLDKVYQESQRIMYIGDKENSNADSTLVSTKRSLIFNELNKELYKKFFLTVDPITYSLKQAVKKDLGGFEGAKHIILLTDGGENCDESPCDFAIDLVKKRRDINIDVIAFNVQNSDDLAQLRCTADVTGGKFIEAKTNAQLVNSMEDLILPHKQVEAVLYGQQ